MIEEKKTQHIRLHLYDRIMTVNVLPEGEEFCRKAAKLITDKVSKFSELYGHSRSKEEILYMVMLDIATNLEVEKTRNDTEPYDDILTKITAEIEDALGVPDSA